MPLVYAALAWGTGLVLGRGLAPQVLQGHSWVLGPLLLSLFLTAFLARTLVAPSHRWRVPALALCVAAGVVRLALALPRGDPGEVVSYVGAGPVALQALVLEDPVLRSRSRAEVLLQARRLTSGDGQVREVRGTLLARVPADAALFPGDLVAVEGTLRALPYSESPSYTHYLLARGVEALLDARMPEVLAQGQGGLPWQALYALRRAAQASIQRILPEPQAGLLAGILLGQKRALPSEVMDQFNATGISHLVVISGWNITVLAALVARACGPWLGRRGAGIVSILGVWTYVWFVGLEPPVVRAGLTGTLVLLALLLRRTALALNSLAAAGIAMTLWRPFLLWDASFQLSFAATLGLIAFASPLEAAARRWLAHRLPQDLAARLVAWANEPLLISLAAQVMVLPLLLHGFGRLSLVAPLANLLVLPVQPPLMAWGAAATVAGLIWTPLGQALGAVVWLLLSWTLGVANLLARLPFASLEVPPWGWGLVILYYLSLGGSVWLLRHPPEARQELLARGIALGRQHSLVVGSAALLFLAALAAARGLPDGRLHVWFLDVGQGDAILVQSADGHQILVDGGPDPQVLQRALGRTLPFWDRTLDLVVLTHPDGDHAGGLVGLLSRYRVGRVLMAGASADEPAAREWQAQVEEASLPLVIAQRGMVLDLGGGALAEVLHPPADASAFLPGDNNGSIVLRLRFGGVAVLLTGDLEREGEDILLRTGQPLQSAVLKVAHHGSARGTTEPFLEAVGPHLAVVSVGSGNRFGHPAAAVLERLTERDVAVLRTDLRGTVEVLTDGQALWVRTER
ncbi:MAG: DNA internalization-related competence protein ComEC/Rec2 [Anaerolineae bacterium]